MKVVAKALLVDSSNELLVLNRGLTHPNFPGHYDLPGGEVEEGESFDSAVAREIKEETGLKIDASQLKKVSEWQHSSVLHILYIGHLSGKKPDVILSWEHSNFRWITIKDLFRHAFTERRRQVLP